jgi:PAS domain-containing protein
MNVDPAVVRSLLDSYAVRTGRELIARSGDDTADAARLGALDAVVLAHDGASDPVFTYANAAAARVFRTTVDDLIGMPSRLSAAEEHRDERALALGRALRRGVVHDYSGIRVARDGSRFVIRNATLWTFVDTPGQAATFSGWDPISDPDR